MKPITSVLVKRGLAKLIRVLDREPIPTQKVIQIGLRRKKKLETLLSFDIKTYQKRANLFTCLTTITLRKLQHEREPTID